MSTTILPHHRALVPAAVKRIVEASDAAFAAQGEQNEQPVGSGPGDTPLAVPDPPGEPGPGGPSSPPAPVVPTQEQVDWKHRYESLKGKHDFETARLGNEISGLHRVLAAVQATPIPPAAPSGPAAPAVGDADFRFGDITPDEVTDYGEEFLSVAERAAARKLAPLIQQIANKVTGLETRLNGVQTVVSEDARTMAMGYLAADVPDWREMDTDAAFLGWLQQIDHMSGYKRQDLLDSALAQNNGPRIAAFFKAFKEQQAPSPAAPPPPANPRATSAPRTSLETFAAPGRGRTGTSPGGPPGAGKIWTQTEIARFYSQASRGAYRNNPSEKNRIEADIIAAATEGRITGG